MMQQQQQGQQQMQMQHGGYFYAMSSPHEGGGVQTGMEPQGYFDPMYFPVGAVVPGFGDGQTESQSQSQSLQTSGLANEVVQDGVEKGKVAEREEKDEDRDRDKERGDLEKDQEAKEERSTAVPNLNEVASTNPPDGNGNASGTTSTLELSAESSSRSSSGLTGLTSWYASDAGAGVGRGYSEAVDVGRESEGNDVEGDYGATIERTQSVGRGKAPSGAKMYRSGSDPATTTTSSLAGQVEVGAGGLLHGPGHVP
jgi:hypothetical protein